MIAAAALVCAVGMAISVLIQAGRPHRGFPESSRVVVIQPGDSARAAAEKLEQEGVIQSAVVFRLLMKLRGAGGRIHAGEYQFEALMTPNEVLGKLLRGDVVTHRLTIPEGLRLDEVADLVSESSFGDRAAFLRAAGSADLVKDLDPRAQDLEGYLFPETYFFARGTSEQRIVAEMVRRFREALTTARLDRMGEIGLTLRQAVTLASLIEEEARLDDERPRIAAVFHNRLRRGMLLQCDPTVVYALTRAGRYRGEIYKSDLSFRSPWNTYAHAGLPPGPISSPGIRSLDAALHPAPVGDLYFVVSGEGRHRFSSTLADHQQAVRLYRREHAANRRR